MFTSSAFAPPRTCSRATSTAPAKSSDSTSVRKREEPVTFVRSPIRTKPVSGPISNGSSPLQRVRRGTSGATRGASPRIAAAIAAVCSGSGAATASGDVQEARLGELAEKAARHLGGLVVAAERIRETGVRVRAHEAWGRVREIRDVGAHLVGAERAVDPDDQRVGMLDRGPEGLDRLPGERAAGAVDDRRRDPERQVGYVLARRGDRGLRVQRVEDRLEQQQVDAALGEPEHLFGVALLDLVEGVRPALRVVDLGAQRERDVERPDRAGDEAVAGGLSRDPRAGDVHLVDEGLEPVVGLPDRGGGEGVRRRDVGARLEVALVRPGDEVRPRQVQDVGIARDVARMVGEARHRGSPRARGRSRG